MRTTPHRSPASQTHQGSPGTSRAQGDTGTGIPKHRANVVTELNYALGRQNPKNMRAHSGKAVLNVLSTLLLAVLAVLVVLLVVIPRVYGGSALTVISGSMIPTYRPGDVVVIRPVPFNEIQSGDAITFQLESGRPEVATHRVVGLSVLADGTREFVTQGDANNAPDIEPVREVQVRGKVIYSIPMVGWATTIFSGSIKEKLLLGAAVGLIGYGAFAVLKPRPKVVSRNATSQGHIVSVVFVSAAAATGAVLSQAAPVYAADMPDQPFSVSTNGVDWQAPPLTSFLPAGFSLVPGSSHTGTVVVRNDSFEEIRSVLDVLIESDFNDFGGDVVFEVTDPASGESMETFSIAAGEQIELEASVSFAADSNDPELMAQDLTLLVTARSALANPPAEEPTPQPNDPTGSPTSTPTVGDVSGGGADDGVGKPCGITGPLAATGMGSLLSFAAIAAASFVVAGTLTRRWVGRRS